MKKSGFTEDQMVRILREADAEPVPKVAKRYGELDVADVRRFREPSRRMRG